MAQTNGERPPVTESGDAVAVVTGAASGIGRAVAERLAADGMRVVGVDRRMEGPAVVQADLTTRAGNRRAIDAALETYGRVDVVVPSAGLQHVAPVSGFPEERWDELVSLLLTSPFLLASYAWPALVESRGRYVAIGSVHGTVASPFKAPYVAAKHGLLGLVKVLALEGAPHGVTATAVCPGYVRTPLVERQIADQARAHELPVERVLDDVILAPHAVKRLIEPAEVAAAVAWLLTPAGRSVTGAPLVMDLGWSAR
jgi:3-hydroxybutyrate dehydrogenase